MSISSSAIQSVRIARLSTDVNAMSKAMPSAFSSRPASAASSRPLPGQVDVDPAGEEILEVPDALAVAQEQKFAGAHVGISLVMLGVVANEEGQFEL